MLRKIGLILLWIGFVGYAFLLAPPNRSDTYDLIINLSTGNWSNINPLIIALFNLMGILPMIYSCFLLIDGVGQKLPAWAFLTVSFGVGAFAILPYLALRKSNPNWHGEKNLILKIVDSRWLGIILTIATISLIYLGFSSGNWSNFSEQWHTNRFIHVMSLDFCLLCLLLPTLLKDDLSRRNLNSAWVFWSITSLPLFGTLIYLCCRPSLSLDLSSTSIPQSS